MTLSNYNRMKHIWVFLGWTVVMLVNLFTYFHRYRLYIFLIAFIYMLYEEVIQIKNEDSETGEPLTESVTRIIGVTSLTFLMYYLIPHWPMKFGAGTPYEYIWGLVISPLYIIKRSIGLQCGLLIMLLLGVIKINPRKYLVLDVLYQYMPLSAVCFHIIYAWTGNVRLGVFYFALAGIFLFNDILRYQNDRSKKIKCNGWFTAFSIILLILLAFVPTEMAELSEKGFLTYWLLEKNFTVKNTIFICVIIALLEGICWKYRKKTSKISDEFLFLIWGSIVLVCSIAYNFYSGYWMIILLIYFIISVKCILNSEEQIKGFILNSVAAIALMYEAHSGRIISFGLLVVCIYITYSQITRSRQQPENPKFVYTYQWTVMLLMAIGVVTAGRIFEVRNIMSNYIVLIISAVIFSILVVIMGYNPGIFAKSKKREYINCIPCIILFAVLCAGLTLKGGSSGQIEVSENGKVEMTVEANGEENSVERAELYWMDDAGDTIFAKGENVLPKEEKIKDFSGETSFQLEKSGRLKIIITDQYGVKTTMVRWYHINPDVSDSDR